MNQNSLANLKPWQTGQSGNPLGRKVGSKNIATIVQELLEQDIDTCFPINDRIRHFIADNGTTYGKAIAYAMLLKAIEGDVRAAIWISEQESKSALLSQETGLFNASKIEVEIVKSTNSALD